MKFQTKILMLIGLFAFVSCKEDGKEFQRTFSHYNSDNGSKRSQNELNKLTKGGKTFPSSFQVTDVINNPGDVNYKCYTSVRVVKNKSNKDSGYIYSLKNYQRPAKGCIPVSSVDLKTSRQLMSSQNLTTKGASKLEERTIGAGLLRIQQLNGGVLPQGKWKGKSPYPFRFVDNQGTSGQRHNYILINRKGKKKYGLSVAQHVHEYAHFIGNRGGYGDYKRFMKNAGYCKVSNYADNSSGEQFAEVFTAFVTEPSILLSNTRTPKACKKALTFFKKWFKKGERVKDCM